MIRGCSLVAPRPKEHGYTVSFKLVLRRFQASSTGKHLTFLRPLR